MASILFHGEPVKISGTLPKIGSEAPYFSVVNGRLENITMSAFTGKKKILSIVTSLDTPVCSGSTRKFNEKAAKFHDAVVLIVSADLPFAQCRFCESEKLHNVIPLSIFRSNFAELFGIKMTNGPLAGLPARAIAILDETDRIIYTQLVQELTDEPDYDAIAAFLSEKMRID